MIKPKHKSGFTLIEVIVVMLIVGALAALALPALFKNTTKVKGAEGIASLRGYYGKLYWCLKTAASPAIRQSKCFDATNPVVPTETKGNFDYSIKGSDCQSASPTPGAYCIKATLHTGDQTKDYVALVGTDAVKYTVKCTFGSGIFSGIC